MRATFRGDMLSPAQCPVTKSGRPIRRLVGEQLHSNLNVQIWKTEKASLTAPARDNSY